MVVHHLEKQKRNIIFIIIGGDIKILILVNKMKEKRKEKNNKIYVSWGKKDKTGKRDVCDTRLVEAEKMVNYIKNIISLKSKIWCPFDTKESNIVIALKNNGYINVINTHIDNGEDFFETKVDCDYIISNPPFQNRTSIFDRLYSFNKPFIMLQPIQAFNNNSYIRWLIRFNNDIGFLCPNNRMGFIVNGVEKTKTTAFYSFWHCYKINGVNGFVAI